MPVAKRAKQFMPFSAVQGLQEALHRKGAEIEDYDTIEHISEQEMIEECWEKKQKSVDKAQELDYTNHYKRLDVINYIF